MSAAKTDGEMMNCCTPDAYNSNTPVDMEQYRYSYSGGGYTSSYDPSNNDSGACPLDRAGNSIYAAFPALGDQIANCRSSCLNGHPQDYSFTLYDQSNGGPLPIAERGIEIYENYGLDTNIRTDSAKYAGKSDGNRCITDLGRKVSLYGNITFTINLYSSQAPSNTISQNVGVDKTIRLGSVDVYYTIEIDYSAYASTDRYPYFGNYGVTFHYGGGTYPYIHGQMSNLPEVGYTNTSTGIIYYISTYQFMVNKFGLTAAGYINPESILIRDPSGVSITTPNNDSKNCSNWNYNTGMGAPLFPVPYSHSYFVSGASNSNNTNYSDYSSNTMGSTAWNCTKDGYEGYGSPSIPFNCSASGAKSAYIPPHMEITNIYYSWFRYDSGADSDDATPIGTSTTFTGKTVRAEDSLYQNGTFPAFGTTASNLPYGSSSVTTGRNAVIAIPPGSLYSVTTHVRQDDDFYNKYIKYSNTEFAPEIFLIPGIQNASQFPAKLSAYNITSKLGNPLQLIHSGGDFWTSLNPYWDQQTALVVNINNRYLPGQVLYGTSDSPPAPGAPRNVNINYEPDGGNPQCTTSNSSFVKTPNKKGVMLPERKVTVGDKLVKSLKGITSKALGAEIAMYNKYKYKGLIAAKKTLGILNLSTTATAPTGQYRIKSFDVINGVYSIEWLYVIYFCAMSGRNSVQYDSGSKQYVTPGCTPGSSGQYGTNTCGRECMLFRDDYTYFNTDAIACPADTAMQAYGGMRNLSLVYGTWQPISNLFSNDCACITTQNYCPAQFNPLCSKEPSNTQTYVTAAMLDCLGSSVCNYCNVQVNQVVAAIYGCTDDSGNQITNFGSICGDAECEYSVTVVGPDGEPIETKGSGSGSGSESGETPVYKKYILLLLIVIIIAIVIGIVAYKSFSYFVTKR